VNTFCLSHLPDPILLRDLAGLVARERATTAALLAHLAEVDARRLYVPAAHPSMYSYCVHELRLSEDAAYKRIQAARAARQFPALFTAVAQGRLHLTAVCLLAPHLKAENVDELLGAAAGKSKLEIEAWLAQRFPRSEMLPIVETLGAVPEPKWQLAPGQVESSPMVCMGALSDQLAPGQVDRSAPARRETFDLRPKLVPIAPQRFVLQLTMRQELHDKLRYAQELLSHQVPSGDVGEVIERALDALIPQLEKRKFAKTTRPRSSRPSTGGRQVPAHVKRAVWERDGGRCTFVSETGHRCPARKLLEFDHVEEVARGGRATVDGMRLRCRAHNQYGAERTFGVEFMRHKRESALRAVAARAQAVAKEKAEEVVPWLRALGFRAEEARCAASLCESMLEASLEQRIRTALGYFAPRSSCRIAPSVRA